jgi:hypothetical protein
VEWDAWLHRNRTLLPQVDDGYSEGEQVAKIAVETGRNMLFLSPFIRPATAVPKDWTFAAAWGAFLRLKEVSKIHRNLKDFVGRLTSQSYPSRGDALDFMASAICGGSVQVDMPNFYDARYFCVLEGIACTIGQYISRCAASVMESQRRLDLFRDSLWINTIRLQRTNPSVLGFLVEKAVLGYMTLGEVVARVLHRPELRSQRVEVRSFKLGTEASSLTSANVLTLYIPEEFNYKAVDAVLRIVERRQEKPQAQPSRKSRRRSNETPSNKRAKVATSAAAASSGAVRQGDTHPDEAEVEDETAVEHDPPTTTTVTLVPLQITTTGSVSATKRAKSFRFFERRAAWLADFQDDARVTIHHRFAFIVRQCALEAEEPKVAFGHNEADGFFHLTFVPLAAINEQLDRAVDSPASSAAAAAAAHQRSPPKLHLGAGAGPSGR